MEGEVVSPSQMVAFGDGQGGNSYFVPAYPQVSSHVEKYNVLLCDGHIEFIERHRLFDPKDETSRRRWNYDFEPH
jgi:prepilin-type processing-associated H-X9-DG protein